MFGKEKTSRERYIKAARAKAKLEEKRENLDFFASDSKKRAIDRKIKMKEIDMRAATEEMRGPKGTTVKKTSVAIHYSPSKSGVTLNWNRRKSSKTKSNTKKKK